MVLSHSLVLRSITLLFLFYSSGFIFGQEVPKIVHFNPTDYDASPQNWQISQDCNNYIFVANTDGVIMFNGFIWKKILLPGNSRARSIFQGRDCKIFVSGFECFGYINIENPNQPKYVPINDDILKGSGQEFWNVFGNQDRILVQSFSDVYEYDYNSLKKLSPPTNIMLGNSIHNRLFLPKIEQGLYELTSEEFQEIEIANNLPDKSKIAGICNHSNSLIIATQYHGLFIMENESLKTVETQLNEQLKNDQINKIIKLDSGKFAIGTILNGVYITSDFKSINFHINKSNGLSNNTVLSLFEDAQGKLWVGLDKGLNLIFPNNPASYFYDTQGDLGSVFTSIYYNEDLYMGTNQGVFRQLSDGTFSLITDSQGQAWSFLEIDNDLICGHNTGTYIIEDDKFESISNITGGWCMQTIAQNTLIQSSYTGLIKLEKKDGKWEEPARVENGNILIENFVIRGQILFGYHPNYGLCRLRFNNDFTKILESDYYDNLDGNNISNGLLIFNLKNGIHIYDSGNFFKFQNNELKKSGTDFTINENPELTYLKNYRQLDLFNSISNIRFNNHTLNQKDYIFGSDNGYMKVPARIENNIKTNPIELDYLIASNSEKVIKEFDNLIMRPSQKNLTVQLKNLNYFKSSKNLKYKLNNWDGEWHNVPKNGRINFINLDDGNYDFLLLNENIRTLFKFKKSPFWFESWPGAILYISILFGLILYFDKRQKSRLIRQKDALQKEKEEELEKERIKAKTEKLEREVTYKNKMLANSTMTLIQKNKMLIELKNVIAKSNSKDKNPITSKSKILHLIDKNMNSDQDWELFEETFAEVHEDFLNKLKGNFPDLSGGDLKLAAYIRMNLSSKEIAPLLNISLRSVENKRYRLRKKLEISHDNNLKNFLQNF